MACLGEAKDYDELVLATGSAPFVPPVKGLNPSEVSGIFLYRTIEDMESLPGFFGEFLLEVGGWMKYDLTFLTLPVRMVRLLFGVIPLMVQKSENHHLLDVKKPGNNGINDQPQLVSLPDF